MKVAYIRVSTADQNESRQLEAMNDKKAQPELGKYIMNEYSVTSCMERLVKYMNDNLK